MPPSRPPADGSWPAWWTQECEDSFHTLKSLVVQAVELQVPDFAGSANGTNLFHIWPDACSYGVGAGLFQGYPREVSEVPGSHYHALGVPTWATKADIVERFRE